VNTSVSQPVLFWDHSISSLQTIELLGEEPLSIRIEGKPYSVVMRTPGDEIAHVAGFCLGEGIIDTTADYVSIAYCDADNINVVAVTLTPERRGRIADIMERRNYISQTSCGICGKELVADLHQILRPVAAGPPVALACALAALDTLSCHQQLRRKTRASHAAGLWDAEGRLLSVAEDIGRHNALDKAIGKALLADNLSQSAFLVMSSRMSYELVQKAARARIPAMFSVSRPTGLAVDLASRLNMGLACLAPKSGVYVFCGQERFRLDS
jgi:FdhD protein